MNRCLAFLGALLLAFISVSSACTAAPAELMHFTLEPERGREAIHATFRSEGGPGHENNWSTDFRPSDLVGLDLAALGGASTRPLRFALIREAGRLDCSGQGGAYRASGDCSFTPNRAFAELLESRGMGRPTRQQAFGLMASNARRELIDAIAAAHYPTPKINDLIALAALNVDGAYIGEMARAGYRPGTIDTLIQFKALRITPQWIAGFVRTGYADLPADELVQLKALDITPEFIAGFERIGFGHLPVDTLVQLKAMDITPDFVRRVAGKGGPMPDIGKLVELKAFKEKN
jgi:hypothetical protein